LYVIQAHTYLIRVAAAVLPAPAALGAGLPVPAQPILPAAGVAPASVVNPQQPILPGLWWLSRRSFLTLIFIFPNYTQ
jgi:hypothetical protein